MTDTTLASTTTAPTTTGPTTTGPTTTGPTTAPTRTDDRDRDAAASRDEHADAGPVESAIGSAAAAIDHGTEAIGAAVADLVGLDEHDDAGLGRALVLGGLAGFAVVYALAFALFATAGGYDLPVAAGAAVFVGLFGGIGFGAMVGASLHH